MRIMIIGANGQLGGDLVKVIQDSPNQHVVIQMTHQEIEVTDVQSIKKALETNLPDVVINTAAYHKVDEVEGNPEKAFAVNAIAPWNVAKACKEINAIAVFISSDYVFGGDLSRRSPYSESDLPAPVNVYGASKLAGEALVKIACDQHFIIRTTGLYGVRGASGKGGNFVELMLRLANEGKEIKVVNDQRLTPTYTIDLAQALIRLVETRRYGLYHLTSEGNCTWYEFAAKIFELSELRPNFKHVASTEFKTAAARPSYSVLAKNGYAEAGLPPMRPWQLSLEDYLRTRLARS